MPRQYSPQATTAMNQTSAKDVILILLEISHPSLVEPIRVVNDIVDWTSNGKLFQAYPFEITMPDDQDGQAPKARLVIDNIGRDIGTWLEVSRGGLGAKCRVMQICSATPNTIELDLTFDMTGMSANLSTVSATLEYKNTLFIPAVAVKYRPESHPRLF